MSNKNVGPKIYVMITLQEFELKENDNIEAVQFHKNEQLMLTLVHISYK